MAKSPDKPEKDQEKEAEVPAPAAAPAAGGQPQQRQRVQVEIDDSHVVATYANFCRVTGTPEELIIDFGLNPQPYGVPSQPIKVNQRLITNFYTAKRMLHALTLTIQRHEVGQGMFKNMAVMAPAMGMIGTLVGLVQMLANMANPQDIGPAMAVALLTTLYGALLANLIFLPLADKLALRSQEEQISKNLILDAVLGIARGLSGMVFQETLKIHLSPKDRLKIVPKASSGGSAL